MIPKFRAWHKKDNWYVDISGNYTKGKMYDVEELLLKRKEIVVSREHSDSCQSFGFNEVIIMQSTGLKDKNGKETFTEWHINGLRNQNLVAKNDLKQWAISICKELRVFEDRDGFFRCPRCEVGYQDRYWVGDSDLFKDGERIERMCSDCEIIRSFLIKKFELKEEDINDDRKNTKGKPVPKQGTGGE